MVAWATHLLVCSPYSILFSVRGWWKEPLWTLSSITEPLWRKLSTFNNQVGSFFEDCFIYLNFCIVILFSSHKNDRWIKGGRYSQWTFLSDMLQKVVELSLAWLPEMMSLWLEPAEGGSSGMILGLAIHLVKFQFWAFCSLDTHFY